MTRNDIPSGPAAGRRLELGGTRTYRPGRISTVSSSISSVPLPESVRYTSSWPDSVSSCSEPTLSAGKSIWVKPKAVAPM